MEKFKDLRIVDNFYQTSAFFPMPTILASTVSESGQTNLGAYSLCFPYYDCTLAVSTNNSILLYSF